MFKLLGYAQDDEGDAEPTAEELCENRAADEYFRLSTEGDCRDVVRYVCGFTKRHYFSIQHLII